VALIAEKTGNTSRRLATQLYTSALLLLLLLLL